MKIGLCIDVIYDKSNVLKLMFGLWKSNGESAAIIGNTFKSKAPALKLGKFVCKNKAKACSGFKAGRQSVGIDFK